MASLKQRPWIRSTSLIIALMVFKITAACASEAPAEPASKISEWVDGLRSEDFATREEASRQLWSLGDEAIAALRQVSDSEDPEQARRARVIIRNISLDVDEATAKAVLQAIDTYQLALSIENKEMAIRELIGLKAYKQVVLLLHHEPNIGIKAKLSRSQRVKHIGIWAASQSLENDGVEAAIRILYAAPTSRQNLKALAFLLKRAGKLEAEIQTMLESGGLDRDQREWVLTMLKTQGDRQALKAFASKHRYQNELAVLALLEGDARPVIEVLDSAKHRVQTQGVSKLLDILNRRSSGFNLDFALEDDDSGDFGYLQKKQLIDVHAALGDVDVVVDLLSAIDDIQLGAFRSSFPYDKSIWSELSIPDPHSNDFDAWVAEMLQQSIQDDKVDEGVQQLVILVIDILMRAGERDIVANIYQHYLRVVSASGDDFIYEVVKLMVETDFGAEAFDYVSHHIEDVDVILPNLSRHLFGDDSQLDFLMEKIEGRHQQEDSIAGFRFLFDVMGGFGTPSPEAMGFLARIETDAAKAGGKAYWEALQALYLAAESRGAFAEQHRLSKLVIDFAPKDKKEEAIATFLQMAQVMLDDQGVSEAFEMHAELNEEGVTKSALYAASVYAQGKERGEKLIDEVLTNSLGVMRLRLQLAYQLHQVGLRDRAQAMLENLLLETSPHSKDFATIVATYCQLSRGIDYMPAGDEWAKLAAMRATQLAHLMDPESESRSASWLVLQHGEFCHALAMAMLEQGDKKFALTLLNHTHEIFIGHGGLADHFFPSALASSIKGRAARWFASSWASLERQIAEQPNNHDALNSAAWLAARAGLKLEQADGFIRRALELRKGEPSYLDTLAELRHAQKRHKEAVEASDRSIEALVEIGRRGYSVNGARASHLELTRQNQKFRAALERANN